MSTINLLLICAVFVLLIFTSAAEGSGEAVLAQSAKVSNSLDNFNALLPMHPFVSRTKAPSVPKSQIAPGLDLPKNLIAPTPPCSTQSTVSSSRSSPVSSGSISITSINNGSITSINNSSRRISNSVITNSSRSNGCPVIMGTNGPDIIIATAISNPIIYGLGGNDAIACGTGHCKVYGGSGDNIMMSSSSATAQLYGGPGNNIFIGSGGDTLMVGGTGNDQFYAGSGHDVMIGGNGANYFDCGAAGNGVILNFNAKNGDTKASDCKFAITVNTGVPALP